LTELNFSVEMVEHPRRFASPLAAVAQAALHSSAKASPRVDGHS
jgi:hypothetical protein